MPAARPLCSRCKSPKAVWSAAFEPGMLRVTSRTQQCVIAAHCVVVRLLLCVMNTVIQTSWKSQRGTFPEHLETTRPPPRPSTQRRRSAGQGSPVLLPFPHKHLTVWGLFIFFDGRAVCVFEQDCLCS